MTVTLPIDGEAWTVHFLDISRLRDSWVIECAIDGPRRQLKRVTIRAAADVGVALTARRVFAALLDWLLLHDPRDHAVLELSVPLQEAS